MNDMRGVFVLLMLLINIKVMDTSNATCPDVCPRGKESWIKRGVALKCVNSSSYHCIEIVDKGLCELCFPKFKVSDAGCPKLRWDQGSKQYYQAERNSECPVNIIGCPNPKLNYTSDELYKFPQCNGNNQSAIDETRSTQHIPPSTQPTKFTESLGNNTSSENGDDSTNHAAVISIVVVLVLALIIVGVLLLVCKRKVLINWCMAKIGRRTSEAQTDVGHPNEAANEATVPLLTNDKQTGHAFVETLRATYRKGWWVLRCKVSVEDTPCTWFRTRKNTDTEIHDGTEFKMFSIGTYRILHIQGSSGLDGRFRCELEDGSKEEIDVDFDETKTIQVKAGEACTLIRVMDETGLECKWFRNDNLIQRNEHFHIAMSNNESHLTIANVQSNDETTFRSKIGEEIQFYTIEIQDEAQQTLRKSLDHSDEDVPHSEESDVQRIECPENDETDQISQTSGKENERFANPVDESDSREGKDEQRPATRSVPPARKVHNQNELLDQIMGRIFQPFGNWSSIVTTSDLIVDQLKELAGVVCGNENLQSLRSDMQEFTSECRDAIAGLRRHITSLIGAFQFLPNPIDRQRRQKSDYLLPLEMLQESVVTYIGKTQKAKDKLHRMKKSYRKKLNSAVMKYKNLRQSPEELDSVTLAEAKIMSSFDKICDTILDQNEGLNVLNSFLTRRQLNKQNDSTLISIIQTIHKGSGRLVNERKSFENSFERMIGELDAAYQIYYSFNENNAQRNDSNVDIDSKGMVVSYKDK